MEILPGYHAINGRCEDVGGVRHIKLEVCDRATFTNLCRSIEELWDMNAREIKK